MYADKPDAFGMMTTIATHSDHIESSFKGFELQTETCYAKASGASDIQVTVNKELSADANGASDIRYKGDGLIRDIKSSGSGSVERGR